MNRIAFAALVVLVLPSCASAPPPRPAAPTYEQKLSWILRLEDQRVLRIAPAPASGTAAAAGLAAPPTAPDLELLVADPEARVRRRAALAIGRVGLREGVQPLERLLNDPEPEVRQMAAFAMGLLGDRTAVAPLAAALADSSALVQGRAAEALGAIGAREQAGAIAAMAAGYVAAGALGGLTPDDLTYPLSPEAEAVRLSLYALARLKSYDGVARVGLDPSGAPVTHWWPLAYALRRVEDPRAVPALMALLSGEGQYSRAFAARGLGVLKQRAALPMLEPLAADVARLPAVGIEAIRAIGAVGTPESVPGLQKIAFVATLDPAVRAEAITAIGECRSIADAERLLDLLADRAPVVRAAAFKALAATDIDRFLSALSGLDPDPDWRVRAAIASASATLPPETASRLLLPMASDKDPHALPAVYAALASAKVPTAVPVLEAALTAADPAVRAAAAAALGELKAASAVAPLQAAWEAAQKDAAYTARAAILGALADIDRAAALPVLNGALADPDWAVRLRASELLAGLDPARDTHAAIRPAPTALVRRVYEDPNVVSPRYSTHVYLETDKGTIEIELAVLDAPLTVHNFVMLARRGFYDGLRVHRVVGNFVVQDGDPRGDGEGGPGYTIRDELNERPYLRGTMGMALDGKDTGGSQFFITHSPQPHLDGRYTAFGQVVSGIEVVDRLVQGDVVRRVRVWDGTEGPETPTRTAERGMRN